MVLVSRAELPLDRGSTMELARVGELGTGHLAFDEQTTTELLNLRGRPPEDAARLVEMTGGWITGIEAELDRADGAEPRQDLNAYLEENVLRPLPAHERRFLAHTSLLDEITAADARALGQPDAAQLIASLRTRRLPVTWSPDGEAMTPSLQFREFLLGRLALEPHIVLDSVHRKHAELLIAQGEHEQAVDELLQAGETEQAWEQAAEVFPDLVARMDFAPAVRWLDVLGTASRPPRPEVGAVILRVSFALDQCSRGLELFDRHGDTWLLAPGTPHHDESLLILAWCLWHAQRLDEAWEISARIAPGRVRAGTRWSRLRRR